MAGIFEIIMDLEGIVRKILHMQAASGINQTCLSYSSLYDFIKIDTSKQFINIAHKT